MPSGNNTLVHHIAQVSKAHLHVCNQQQISLGNKTTLQPFCVRNKTWYTGTRIHHYFYAETKLQVCTQKNSHRQ